MAAILRTLCLLLVSQTLLAQTLRFSPKEAYTYYYKLDSARLAFIMKQGLIDTTYLFTQKADSSLAASVKLKPGYYLLANRAGRGANLSVQQVPYFNFSYVAYNDVLEVKVLDTAFLVPQSLAFYVNGKPQVKDAACDCYLLPIQKKPHTIYVSDGKNFEFARFNFSPDIQSKQRSNSNSYSSSKTYSYGYALCNQPIYKPKDSVKTKAYLLWDEGEPVKGKVGIYLYANYFKQRVLIKQVSPVSPGAYVLDFKLADSLKIDQTYSLQYIDREGTLLRTISFKLEDYKLRSNTYEAFLSKTKFYKGEAVQVQVRALDINGLPLPNANVKAKFYIRHLRNFTGTKAFVPEEWYQTLYETAVPVESNGPTLITLPEAILSDFDATLTVEILVTDVSGESKFFKLDFEKVQDSVYYLMALKQDGLVHASCINLGKPQSKYMKLRFKVGNYLLDSSWVLLPAKIALLQFANNAELLDSSGKLIANCGLHRKQDYVAFDGFRKPGEISIELYNPSALKMHIQLFRGKQKIIDFFGDTFSFQQKDTSRFTYHVIYSLQVQDGFFVEERTFPFLDKTIEITHNIPQEIYPGQTVAVDVKLSLPNRKPAADVNLTAYAINAQFGENYQPALANFNSEVPPLLERQQTGFERLPYSYINRYIERLSYTTLLSAGLLTQADYRLMYPNEDWMVIKDSTYQATPEVLPMVVANGMRIPVYAIKVDQKFYAFRNLNNSADFPILVSAGTHQLSVRTKSAWFHLPKFRFEPNQHYVMSFDTLCLPAGIVKVPMSSKMKFSEEEIDSIKSSLLFFEPGNMMGAKENIRFKQGVIEIPFSQNMFICTSENDIPSKWAYGPFKSNDSIQVFKGEQLVQTFWFNPKKHYTYYQNKLIGQEASSLSIDFNTFYFQTAHADFYSKYNTYDKVPTTYTVAEPLVEEGVSEKLYKEKCNFSQSYVPDGINFPFSLHLTGGHTSNLFQGFIYNEISPRKSISLPTFYQSDIGRKISFSSGKHTFYLIDFNRQLMIFTLEEQAQIGAWYIHVSEEDFNKPCDLINPMVLLTRQLVEAANANEASQITYRVEDYVSKIKLPKYEVNKTETSAEVWGFVTKDEGTSLSDVVITLEQNGIIKGISFSDVSGGFLFKDMAPGIYELRFTRFGSCITILQNLKVAKQSSVQLKVDLKLCGFSYENDRMVPSIFFARKKIDVEKEMQLANSNLFSEKVYEKPIPGTGGVKGKIIDIKVQSALAYVTITLIDKKSKKYTTNTDDNGEFIIRNLAPGPYRLIANFVGYRSVVIEDIEVFASEDRLVSFAMEESNQLLQEVMVVNRKMPSEKAMLAAPTHSIERLIEQNMGVESRTGGTPDFRGARANGTAYYVDGVRVSNASVSASRVELYVPTVNQKSRMYEMVNNQSVKTDRSEFKDYGYWVPNLVSDKKGEAHFTITFPDNITRWQNYIVAMNARLDNKLLVFDTRSFKPLMAQLYLPRFAIEGDSLVAEGAVNNYSGDSIQLELSFQQNDTSVKIQPAFIGAGYRLTHGFKLGSNQNTNIAFQLSTDFGYKDAEKRSIPVFPNGIMSAEVSKAVLRGDSSWEFTTDSIGESELSISNTFTQLLKEEIERLQNYAYGCVEQTTSKLSALLIEKSLNKLMGDTFTKDNVVKLCLNRLADQQHRNGGWGWFRDGYGEVWISHYVMKTLWKAKQMGYATEAVGKGISFFQKNLASFSTSDRILAMDVLFLYKVEFDLNQYLRSIDETSLNATDRLRLNLLKQQMGEPSFAGYLFSDLKMNKDSSIWWNYSGRGMYQSTFSNTLLAYELLKGSETPSWILKGVKQYFLREKLFGTLQGLNTLDAARIIEMFAIEMALEEKGTLKTSLSLNNIPLANQSPARYPLEKNKKYQLMHKGPRTFVQVNRRYWNSQPQVDSNKFVVSTKFLQEKKEVQQLKQNVPLIYNVSIQFKQDVEFILVKIPIPASCEYADKPSFSGAVEVSYHKNEVWVFYRSLAKGTKVLSFRLEPRFGGSFTLLPVQIEQMYEPELRGNNEVKRVKVKY